MRDYERPFGLLDGVCVLAVSDEPDEVLAAEPRVAGSADLIVACGDLPFDYLGAATTPRARRGTAR
jgi:hypothetical protein